MIAITLVRVFIFRISHLMNSIVLPELWEDRAVDLEWWFRSGIVFVGTRLFWSDEGPTEAFPMAWRSDKEILFLLPSLWSDSRKIP